MQSNPGPSEGRAWRPAHSGNSVSWNGSAVVKRYGANVAGFYLEYSLLPRLAPLPVPTVLDGTRPGELHLAYVDAVPGGAAIEGGNSRKLLRELGRFLRQLHDFNVQSVAEILPGEGEVIVHGDFAHYNCLFDPEEERLAAVLDWETAHLGNRVEDLAWCEWQFRNRYPHEAWAIAGLFEGYGETPDGELRERAVQARIAELRRGQAAPVAPPESSAGPSAAPVYQVVRFQRRDETAAFAAALTRFLHSPGGTPHLPAGSRLEVWFHGGARAQELWLSDQAVNAAAEAFGHVRVSEVRRQRPAGPECKLLIAGDQVPVWGMEDAELALRRVE